MQKLRKISDPWESKDAIHYAGQKLFIHCYNGRSFQWHTVKTTFYKAKNICQTNLFRCFRICCKYDLITQISLYLSYTAMSDMKKWRQKIKLIQLGCHLQKEQLITTLRVHLQIMIWETLDKNVLDPLEWVGVCLIGTSESVFTKDIAADALLNFVGCKCQTECTSKKCPRRKHALKGVTACGNFQGNCTITKLLVTPH